MFPLDREEAFLAWLAHAGQAASQVVLNGDLFDFWFEYVWGIPRGHERVLGLLKEIVEGGTPVTLMGGNHDWWGGRYLREEIGLEFLTDPVTQAIRGAQDVPGPRGRARKGRPGLPGAAPAAPGARSRASRFPCSRPPWATASAAGSPRPSTDWDASTEDEKDRSTALEAWALAKLRAEPGLDLVVLGHTHIPRLWRSNPGGGT